MTNFRQKLNNLRKAAKIPHKTGVNAFEATLVLVCDVMINSHCHVTVKTGCL